MYENFKFVIATDFGVAIEDRYTTRDRADQHFADLITNTTNKVGIYYYAASVGGLVNAYHEPK